MSLNEYRDEVAEFLEQVAATQEPVSRVIPMLDEEVTLLKESLNDRKRLSHQLYDVLFPTTRQRHHARTKTGAGWTAATRSGQGRIHDMGGGTALEAVAPVSVRRPQGASKAGVLSLRGRGAYRYPGHRDCLPERTRR